ncbi:GNAT family N-acetyltransferase [Nocardia alni]|uniref:GNAT family N-acetyltransferase n=1 Tax=Nocardia alni TaxID=2815723 RepID=UPI001C21ABC1|nr:GNAT family N-acetyltransferase [Nocardia alni]
MLTIRPARAGDAPALADLAHDAYAHYVPRMGREPAPMRADYAALIQDGGVWVAEHDGVPAGMLVLVIEADHVLLSNVAVSSAAQGSGIGSELLAFTERQAREHDRSELRLYTNEAMTENIGYYSRRGYVETGRATEDGYRRVYFTKYL